MSAHLEIVIPVYNEMAVLPQLFATLEDVFSAKRAREAGISKVTCTLIDDGSRDGTPDWIAKRIPSSPLHVRLISLSRNFGHQSAVSAGLSQSVGDLVAVIDADLQDPPSVIYEMVAKHREGFDVVYGVRKKRKENFIKKFAYWAFYRLYKFLSSVTVPLDAGDFALMTRRVVVEMNALSETLRFPRGLRAWVGFRQTGIPYERAKRAEGESKYGFKELYKLASNGITSLSTKPLHLTQVLAVGYMFLMVFFMLYLTNRFFHPVLLQRDTLVILCFLCFSNLLIMATLHIHGSYIGRGYMEMKGRPNFIIASIESNESKEPTRPASLGAQS